MIIVIIIKIRNKTTILKAYGPRIFIQPFFTAIMDYYIIKLCRVYFGEKYVKIAVIANFTMNLSIIQGIRTYANSIEATFFIIALYYWLKSSNDKIESY